MPSINRLKIRAIKKKNCSFYAEQKILIEKAQIMLDYIIIYQFEKPLT